MFEKTSHLTSRIFASLMVFTLAVALLPLPAFAEQDGYSTAASEGESAMAASEGETSLSVQAVDFQQIGDSDCEWKIENGKLIIQPTGGKSTGTLPNGPTVLSTASWPWTDQQYTRVEFRNKVIAGKSMANFFRGSSLQRIENNDIKNLSTSKVEEMSNMFFHCESLTNLDLRSFDTSSVKNMSYMFWQCKRLSDLNVSSFNTLNVTNMSHMFGECEHFTTLNLSSFDTRNVTNMSGMFYYCISMPTFDLSRFNTSNVTDMREMFKYCKSIRTLNLSNFNTSKVTDMTDMFTGCSFLDTLDIRNFDTTQAKGTATGLLASINSLNKFTIGSNFTGQNAFPAKTWYNEKAEKFDQTSIPLRTAGTYTSTNPYASSGDPEQPAGTITMYRLYNPNTGEHLFTQDTNEYKVLAGLGWKQEGIAWYAPETGGAVYRLYNPNSGDHHYTTDKNEYDTLGKLGWKQEGIAWRSGGDKVVYRIFNPNVKIGTHHYTTDFNEYSTLGSIGWKKEGIGWYGR